MSKKSPKSAAKTPKTPKAPKAAKKPSAKKAAKAAEAPKAAPVHADIAKLAREIWEERQRPRGQDFEIWLEAERRLSP